MKCLIGTKLNMTQVFREDGAVVPVTRISAGPCVVTKIENQSGKQIVEIGFGKKKHLNKPEAGHLKDLPSVATMRSFVTGQTLQRGDTLTVTSFGVGDRIDVTGISKGKGFQGVVKRHHFGGGPASHGHKDNLRMPGSIGATDSQRVYKGTRMGGHMGSDRVTVKNLEVIAVDEEKNELLVKGAVPGARGSVLVILADAGEMAVVVAPVAAEEVSAIASQPDASEAQMAASATAETATPEVVEVSNAPTPVEEKKEDATPANE